MKKILVPTDFSDYAEKALHYAVGIATETNAEILLVHVCELLHYPFADRSHEVTEYNDLKTGELTQRLNSLKSSTSDSNVVITPRLYDGEVIDAIISIVEQEQVDLIVMGTLGATGIKTVFLGTKTATIIS